MWIRREAFFLTVSAVILGVMAPVEGHADGVSAEEGPAAAMAPDTLRGQVTDGQNQPIEGVEVLLPELSREAFTGVDGRFSLPSIPPGVHSVVFRRLGYDTKVEELTLPAGTPVRVTLASTPFELPGFTVTATRRPLATSSSPLPATILSGAELRRSQSVSLSKTVENLPGVRTLSTGEQIGKPVIRGSAGAGVLVLENGMRLEDYSWSDEDGPSVDARLADRVEVIRGPASVLYGSEALGGVVNVIPEAVPEARGGEGFVHRSAEAYFATNNLGTGGVLTFEGASGPWGWRATGIGRFAEDLHTPGGKLENTGFFAVNGEGALARRGPWGRATLRYSRYGGEFRLLEAGGPPPGAEEGAEEGPERKTSDDRIQFVGNFPLASDMVLETKAQWERHWLQEVSDELGPGGPGTQTEVPVFDLLLNTSTADALLHHSLLPGVRGTVGMSGEYQSNDTRGVVPLVPDATGMNGALFALENVGAGPVNVLAGARLDLRRLRTPGNATLQVAKQTLDYTAATWSLGTVLRLDSRLSLTANVGRAWRAPTLAELFSYGPRLGEARFDIGDPGLEPEKSLSLDAGLRWSSGRVRAEASAYRNRISDFIYTEPTQEEQGGLRVYRQRQASAVLKGGEASLRVQVASPLTLEASGDFVRGTNEDLDQPLPLMPPPRGLFAAEVRSSTLPRVETGYFRAEAEVVGKQTHLAPSDYATDSYSLLNLEGGVELPISGHHVRMELRVRNALDKAYKDFLWRYKEFALDPGRDVIFRVSTDF